MNGINSKPNRRKLQNKHLHHLSAPGFQQIPREVGMVVLNSLQELQNQSSLTKNFCKLQKSTSPYHFQKEYRNHLSKAITN
jgi:hypothetical protein